ncbi:unnamed protein product [Coccothraustes coccothraustes]
MVRWWLLAAVLHACSEAVGCASLVAMGKQLLPCALSSLLQCIESVATASGWTYAISCKAQSDLHDPVSTPGLLWLRYTVDSRKTDCPLCVGLLQRIKLLVWAEDDFLDYTNTPTTQPLDASSCTETALTTQTPTISFPKDTIPTQQDSTQGCCGPPTRHLGKHFPRLPRNL